MRKPVDCVKFLKTAKISWVQMWLKVGRNDTTLIGQAGVFIWSC
jgi:hypothetical protein